MLHIFDSGHMVSSELVNRAGGLVALSALTFNLNVTNLVKARAERPLPEGSRLSFGYIEHVFETDQLRPGDRALRGQRFGQDRQRGRAGDAGPRARAEGDRPDRPGLQLASWISEHPSGKHLYEVADLVLDNHAPYGDAMLSVEGLDYPVCPASGLGAATVLWAVVAGIDRRDAGARAEAHRLPQRQPAQTARTWSARWKPKR